MTAIVTQEQRAAEAHRAVLLRSATDREFRDKLLTSPRAAIAEFAGVPEDRIPDANIRFIENTADETIVLPPFVEATDEISSDELEAVAGGTVGTSIGEIILGTVAITVWGVVAGEVIGIVNRPQAD